MCPQVNTVVAGLAGRAHGVVTRSELLAAGVTAGEVRRRVRSGALIRVYPGVYRVGHQAPNVEARYLAAVKACGPGAVLSGLAAAHMWGLVRGVAPAPEVTAATVKRIGGIRARRATRIHRTTHKRIPITTVPQTLIDLAADLPLDDLARACHEGRVRHGTRPEDVERILPRNAPGSKRLRIVLRGDEPVLLSHLEREFRRLLKHAGLPLPVTNRKHGAHYVDCRWPEHGLTVELDSYRYHASRHAWEQDRGREREAYARGDELRRYTYGDVTERPDAVVRELEPLLRIPLPKNALSEPPRRSWSRPREWSP